MLVYNLLAYNWNVVVYWNSEKTQFVGDTLYKKFNSNTRQIPKSSAFKPATYEHYNLQRTERESHKVKVSEKMGYKGDVEKTRVSLEKIYKMQNDTAAGITTTV